VRFRDDGGWAVRFRDDGGIGLLLRAINAVTPGLTRGPARERDDSG
jgi:hypothetical protein